VTEEVTAIREKTEELKRETEELKCLRHSLIQIVSGMCPNFDGMYTCPLGVLLMCFQCVANVLLSVPTSMACTPAP
jgi:hypothetical protein